VGGFYAKKERSCRNAIGIVVGERRDGGGKEGGATNIEHGRKTRLKTGSRRLTEGSFCAVHEVGGRVLFAVGGKPLGRIRGIKGRKAANLKGSNTAERCFRDDSLGRWERRPSGPSRRDAGDYQAGGPGRSWIWRCPGEKDGSL